MKPSELKKEFAQILNTKTVFYVDYHKVEGMIDKVFKNERHKEFYHLPASEERGNDGNDQDWEVCVQPESADEDTLQEIFSGEWPMYRTPELLCEMCRRGLIPSGDYLISISW